MVCTLWVPVQNVQNFILTRPPVVIFATCLAAFVVSVLSLGFYVEHTASVLKNPDEMDWNDVISKFNKLSFCIQPGMSPSANTSGMEYVSVPFDLDEPIDKIWGNYSLISGSLSTSDLGLNYHLKSDLHFSLSLIESQKKICLTLFHPKTITLPHPIVNCNPLQYNLLPSSIGAFVIPPQDERTRGSALVTCPETSKISLKLKDNPRWTILLNEDDRSLVSLHMMVTSGFLFVILTCIVCFAAIRGGLKTKAMKPSNLFDEDSKEPLDF